MLRVYLDQNKWVDLARSRKTGFTDGLANCWDIAYAGVERDLLSFPLSAVHYFERTKRVRQDSRWDLAATMAELSRMHTIAGANTLVPQEVDAVAARIYRDQIDPNAPDPSPIEPFGVGAAHALGAPPGTFAGQFSFEELRAAGMPEDMLTLVRRGLVDATELAVLARTESSEQARKIAEQTRVQMGEVDQKFADHQRAFAEHVKDNRLTHRRDEGLSRFDLADIRELILRA